MARAENVVRRVLDAAVGGAHITPEDVALALSDAPTPHARAPHFRRTLVRTERGREVRPRTAGQRQFVRAIERVDADLRHRAGRNRKDVISRS